MFLVLIGLCGFASALATRALDPLVTSIARDFMEPASTVALLSSAFALPYALSQPFLGPIGDSVGKGTVLKVCMWLLALCLAVGALAPSLVPLYAARVLSGIAAGGVIPLALAMIGDRVPIAGRQVAIGRFLVASLIGQLLGATGSGLLAEQFDWRASAWATAVFALIGAAAATWRLDSSDEVKTRTPLRLVDAIARYRLVFRNPAAYVCYAVVFIEGIAIHGSVPFVAEMLEMQDGGGPKEAGLVVAGIGIGGLAFAASVRALLARLGVSGLLHGGGWVAASGLVGMMFQPAWPMQTACFVLIGFGFFMLHNSMQSKATELAPTARGSAVALHAFFFFLGQAAGPALFGLGLHSIGAGPSLAMQAVVIGVTGGIAAILLRRAERPAA
jgi:predicted MFS family arabinose efflux permease